MNSVERDDGGSPLDRVEDLCDRLVEDYGGGDERELRAAAKLLLVALDRFRRFGGDDWERLLEEYVDLAKRDPERFHRVLDSQRGEAGGTFLP